MTSTDPLAPFLALAATAAAGALLIAVVERVVTPVRRGLNQHRARRPLKTHRYHNARKHPNARRRQNALRHPAPTTATAELRARVMMDELCPDGWEARIIIFSSAAELPDGAPDPSANRVALDWADLGDPTVMRRVWAETVDEALEAMVTEQVTDETLRQIEERALDDGVTWPDGS